MRAPKYKFTISLTLLTLFLSSTAYPAEQTTAAEIKDCAATEASTDQRVQKTAKQVLDNVIPKITGAGSNEDSCPGSFHLPSTEFKAAIRQCSAEMSTPPPEFTKTLESYEENLNSGASTAEDLCRVSSPIHGSDQILLLASLERVIYLGKHPTRSAFLSRVDKALCSDALRTLSNSDQGLLSGLNEIISLRRYQLQDSAKEKRKFTAFENEALGYYTRSGFDIMNSDLRSGKPIPNSIKKYISGVNSALSKLPDYQGMSFRTEGTLPDKTWRGDTRIGNTITNRGFTSSSRSPDFFRDHAFLILSVHGKKIEKYSPLEDEKEVLFKSGTRFKILDASQITDDTGEVIMREVP